MWMRSVRRNQIRHRARGVLPIRCRRMTEASQLRWTPGSMRGRSASPPRWWPKRRSRQRDPTVAIDRCLGTADGSAAHLYTHRIISHLSFRSVWFRNAIRGAVGLALAVLVVELTDVSHGFWVVLGTLSVLRSNALGTGATALRAVGGTALGFRDRLGDHDRCRRSYGDLLWALLPLAVLVAGVAPAMVSFVAGQAAFTVTVVILFNIIEPVGWRVGLTRIEDVAIGCGVSVVVGLLFWPRGATAALGRALSDAFVASSGYLADAVDRMTSDLAVRGHRTWPARVAPRLSPPRRRVPSVLRRARGEGRLG